MNEKQYKKQRDRYLKSRRQAKILRQTVQNQGQFYSRMDIGYKKIQIKAITSNIKSKEVLSNPNHSRYLNKLNQFKR